MKIWFTLTGTNHYCGQDFLKKGTKIRLEKEPDNRHDREAIKVLMDRSKARTSKESTCRYRRS